MEFPKQKQQMKVHRQSISSQRHLLECPEVENRKIGVMARSDVHSIRMCVMVKKSYDTSLVPSILQ